MEAKKRRGANFGADNIRQWVVRNWVGKRCQSGRINIAAVATVAGILEWNCVNRINGTENPSTIG
jgi:hypothetical protein